MKKSPYSYFIIIGAVLFVLAVVLYIINPWAPLFLLASLVIQIPIIYGITKASMNFSYQDRAHDRRVAFEATGDAEAWLAGEQKEAGSVGQKFWSSRSKELNLLNQAAPLCALGRKNEAAELLAWVNEEKLEATARKRYDELVEELRAEAPAAPQDGAPPKAAPGEAPPATEG